MARVIRGAARVVRRAALDSAVERELVGGLAELARERARLREGASREIGSLALEVATRLVGEQVCADPALLERIVHRALARARADSAVRVSLHPDDRKALEARLAGRLPDEIVLEDDPAMARGGCHVRGGLVTVDARIETALAVIARAMGIDGPT